MDELLAKPDVTLEDHLQSVLHVGNEIAKRMKLGERLWMKVLLACAFHDIGKATVDFQDYIRGKRRKAYPHALASMPFIMVAESLLGQKLKWNQFDLYATAAVLTHHSPLSPWLYKGFDAVPNFHPQLSQIIKDILEMLRNAGVDGIPEDEEFLWIIQNLIKDSPAAMLDDERVIQNKTLRSIFKDLIPHEFAQIKAVLHISDWVVSSGEFRSSMIFLDGGKSKIESNVRRREKEEGFILRGFQQRAANSVSNVIWLRAPTGSGKTEALLLWAGDAERLIYLLPTQATVNAMWKRMRKIFDDKSVALAHGRANYIMRKDLNLDEDPLDIRLFGSVFAKPVTVATIDQYILAHLNGRHWEERRSFSRRATIILDEIHAYEPYTLGLLLEALEREKPYRLALASATLPPALLNLFPEGELIEAEDNLWERKRHRLKLQKGSLEDGLSLAMDYAQKGENVLGVANTISDAQSLYKKLKEEYEWENCYLLHSRFIFRDRQLKEEMVGNPPKGTIFISTQVVEVSLDISYDVLITEIAPIDALVQRLGRVNRRGEKLHSPVFIFKQWSKGSERIYGKDVLELSLQLLEKISEIPTDRDLAELTHTLYEQVFSSDDWKKEFLEGRNTLDEVQRILGCYTINLSDEEMRERFTARRGHLSVDVIPSAYVQEAYELKQKDEFWRLPELLVPVPIYWLRQSEYFAYIEDLNCIQTTLEYSSEFGLMPPSQEKSNSFVFIE
ncbi:MAG: CRISPR-associated endonuclease/helicase Cas3 [Tepidanaerobacteraceae bacterium]|nr:CRISPR-associated endonuclease/helicase Cas3 [Tepidanaerobacteraceae bacterium]